MVLPCAIVQATKTGPKGVIADYTLHQAELEEQRERKQKEVRDMLEKQAVNFKDEVGQQYANQCTWFA